MVVLALLALGGAVLLGFTGLMIGIDEPQEAKPFLLVSGGMLLATLLFGAMAMGAVFYQRDVARAALPGEERPPRLARISVAGLALGLSAIALSVAPFISVPLAIAGFATSLAARRRIVKNPDELAGKAIANFGLAAALSACVLSVAFALSSYGRMSAPTGDYIIRRLSEDAAPP
jgi:hypothetical protein